MTHVDEDGALWPTQSVRIQVRAGMCYACSINQMHWDVVFQCFNCGAMNPPDPDSFFNEDVQELDQLASSVCEQSEFRRRASRLE